MITASDFRTYYRPKECRRRVWLEANQPELKALLTEFEQILLQEGREHERKHLAILGDYLEPEYPSGDLQAGAQATSDLMAAGAQIIYQGVLVAPDGSAGGKPDFLIREGDAYVIRDAKLALNLDHRPEIAAQISLYAQLAQAAEVPVARCEVVLGDGSIQEVAFVDPSGLVQELAAIQAEDSEPDEAVGWSKCDKCGYSGHCWKQAVDAHDPAVVPNVSQSMRHVFRDMGIDRYDDLPAVPAAQLAELKIPWGDGEHCVGEKTAKKIIRQVRVLMSGELEVVAHPEIPSPGPRVYFDIESNPWDEGMSTRVYLWGLLLDRGDGTDPQYWGCIAPPGTEGEANAWQSFLTKSAGLLDEFGDPPFIHYSHYEKTWVRQYIERWGDPNGTGARVLSVLWDLQRKAISGHLCLPIHSYGLKRVEKCAGFVRSQEDYGSLWSVGRYWAYLNASGDVQQAIEEELLTYNREDCLAMRHVLDWASSLP